MVLSDHKQYLERVVKSRCWCFKSKSSNRNLLCQLFPLKNEVVFVFLSSCSAMETENNFDHEKEGKIGIKEEPFSLETTQLLIKSVLPNTSLQKKVVDVPSVSLIEPEHDTYLKIESEINIKEEPWCVESTSVPGFESEETPPSKVHLENGLVYVSCDDVTEPQNKNNLDRVIKEEPLWKVRSTESKNGALQDDLKDTNSSVNEESPKLSAATQRACTETVSNHGTSTSTLSASADLQENSYLKVKEDGLDCKTRDFAVQLKKNGVQEKNEVHAKIDIKEETWWLDRTSPVKSEPESTSLMNADMQDNIKLSLSQSKKCCNNIKTKWTRDMANETRQFMKTVGDLPLCAASRTSELELEHNMEFWFDRDIDISSSDLSKPAQVSMLCSGTADSNAQEQLCTDMCTDMDAPFTLQKGQTLPSLPQPPLSLPRKCIMRKSLAEVELEMRLKRHRLQMECDAKLQSFREKKLRRRWETTRKEEERRQAFEWVEERKRKAFKWEEERKRKAFKWEEERKRKAFEAEERRKEEKRLLELKMRKKANVLMRV